MKLVLIAQGVSSASSALTWCRWLVPLQLVIKLRDDIKVAASLLREYNTRQRYDE